ncbi:MAG TPA: thioredoxin domain-containing protein [Steroidobacteraceae bacterium]|nr:thioredoxin domain-containing protein [Steroidobacteraceae bacterium]
MKVSYLAIVIVSWMVAGPCTASSPSAEPLAIVDGKPISAGEVYQRAAGELRALDKKVYALKEETLYGLVAERLLQRESQTSKLSVDRLLDDRVYSMLAPPTPEEIQSYYLGVKDRIGKPIDDVRSQIADFLYDSRRRQAYDAYVAELRGKANVVILLAPPRASVAVDPDRVRGAKDAAITIVEFSDFECPYCARAEDTVRQLLSKYRTQIRLAYRDFPLSFHPRAQSLAEASRCAAAQGKFWQFHDYLFEHQTEISKRALAGLPAQLGMDAERFQHCVDQHVYASAVKRDMDDGERLDLEGTPAFFINGIELSGAVPLAEFSQAIDLELERVKRRAQ